MGLDRSISTFVAMPLSVHTPGILAEQLTPRPNVAQPSTAGRRRFRNWIVIPTNS